MRINLNICVFGFNLHRVNIKRLTLEILTISLDVETYEAEKKRKAVEKLRNLEISKGIMEIAQARAVEMEIDEAKLNVMTFI